MILFFSVLFYSLDLELRDNNGDVVLWFAILSSKVSLLDDENDSTYAAKLVKRGSSADAVNPRTGMNANIIFAAELFVIPS